MAKRYHATKVFAKIAALNAAIDGDCLNSKQGARKAKAKLAEHWYNRSSGSVKGFWKAKEARRVS